MKVAGYLRLHVPLAGAMLLVLPLAALADGSTSHSNLIGVYLSHEGKKDPSISVSLGADGSATVTEDTGKGATTFFGRWADSGSQVTVTFDPMDGKTEPPMVFEAAHDGLQAVTWNHAEWGKATPPPMKKGTKVKQKYWFTTVR
jgi:hypothetical protein